MRTLQYHTQRSPRDSHRSLTGGKKPNAISGTGESGWQILKRALAASDPHSSADFFRAIHYPLRPSNMPTLGPSILFAAGLTIGVGAGVLFPRKNSPEKAVMLPPPPPEGNYRGTVSTVATPTGGVSLQGGFPGEHKRDGKELSADSRAHPGRHQAHGVHCRVRPAEASPGLGASASVARCSC